MTPQELKNSILQLAVQGKLTVQLPGDGTGEGLLKQIKAEKDALVKCRQIKKEKPLPEITEDDVPFEIPESWTWAYVGDIFLHNTGKAQNVSGSSNGVMRKFITTSNLYWNHFDFSKVKEMPFTEQELLRCTVRKGDLLVCEGGDCGRSAIWNYDEEVCIQNHVHRLRPYLDVSIEFFYYLFYLYKFTGHLRGRGVAIQGLSNDAIHKVVCPLPPLAEQKRIVAKIEELLPYIDRYEQAWSKLEDFNKRFPVDMQKSILQMAIQGKLVEQRPEEGTGEELYQQIQKEKQALIKAGKIKKEKPLPEITEDEIPFDIPDSWKWVKAGDIINSIVAGKSLKCNESVPENNQAGIIKVSAVTWGSFKENESKTCLSEDCWAEEYAIHSGDFLLSRANTKKLVGACVIVHDISKRLMLSDKILRLSFSALVSPQYMIYCLRSPVVRTQIEASATGTSESMKNISQNNIKQYVIPLPPLAEQKRIVAKLEEILPLCERLK